MADYDNAPMRLVYEHKTNGRKLVPNGLSIMDELDLTLVISENPDIVMITKAINPGSTSVDLYKVDLLQPSMGEGEVPWKVFLGHSFEGHSFNELVILTPEVETPKSFVGDESKNEDKPKNGEGADGKGDGKKCSSM